MIISLIAAMSENGVIGIDNRLPWKLPADMRWFRQNTLNKPVVMGRKTFDSLDRKPLPNRLNIVLSSQPGTSADGVHFFTNIDTALQFLTQYDEVMIIGGASFYQQMLKRADRLYLTIVHHHFEGDAFFPDYTQYLWRTVTEQRHEPDEKNAYACTFRVLERIRG